MDNWKPWIDSIKSRKFAALSILIILAIPVTLVLVFRSQDTRSSAATPNNLETEDGSLSTTGASIKADSTASNQKYVLFNKASTTNSPTPTTTSGGGPGPVGSNYNVPTSIDRTGSTNVTTQLQNFINSVPNGNTIVFPAGSTYLMSTAGIQLMNRNNLYFQGNGARIKTTGCNKESQNFSIGRFGPSSNITINNFILEGGNPNKGDYTTSCGDSVHGFGIYGSTDIYITNVQIRNVYGDCIYTSEYGSNLVLPDNITFTNSSCDGNGRMAVAVVGGKNMTFSNNNFDNIALYVFDIEPNNPNTRVENVQFIDNNVADYGIDPLLTPNFFAANGYDDGAAYVNNITVARNYVTGDALWTKATEGPNRTNMKVIDNTSTVRVSGPVMRFTNNHGVTVTGNKQPLSSGSLASFSSCTNVTYSNNNTN